MQSTMSSGRIVVRQSIPGALLVSFAAFTGCASTPPTPSGAAPPIAAAPVATIDGKMLDWRSFEPLVAEASGGAVLEEVVLEWACQAECAKRGLVIAEGAAANEEARVLATLDADPARAAALLATLKARQGLGPLRWQALLRRNAMLRALVATDIVVDQALVEQARDAIAGPRRQARLIVVADLASIERIRTALRDGASFAELAARESLDPSAQRGGLVTGVTRLDAAYPSVFRNAVFSIAPGGTSEALMHDDRFMLVQVISESAPTAPADLTRLAEERARIAQERVAMERLADRLLKTTPLTVFDEAVQGSLDRMRRERAR